MDCLDPPLLEIPQGNWYCDECFDSSDESEDEDAEEVDDLLNDVEEEIGELPEARLRTRQQQPQILRTMQSERIRNAILARMSLRGAREAFGEAPTTSASASARPRTVRRRRTTRKRKTKRRARTVVVEYDVDGSDKFAMRTRRVAKRRKGRKKRRKVAKTGRRKAVRASAGPSTSFKGVNANVHDLQRGRSLAGLSNFNIFQPTNMLDYVPDEDNIEDSGIEESAEGNLMTQAIIGLSNPQRRNMMIKNRVLQNCTTTSNVSNLLDSIMQDQDMFGPGSIGGKFAVEKSSGKLLFKGKNAESVKRTTDGDSNNGSGSGDPPRTETTTSNVPPPPSSENINEAPTSQSSTAQANLNADDPNQPQNLQLESFDKEDSPKKKLKKPEIDMFDENPTVAEDCPIFSIYDSVDAMVDQDNSSSFQNRPNTYDEENVDLVQMSDNNESSEEAPPAIVASQPASPDVEVDKVGERSYTPPIAMKTSEDGPERDDDEKRRRDRESRRNRKRELERYNVRDRLKERSPVKLKDKFGRNRSRSSSRKKHSRKRSRSYRRSKSRSRSRRRTPSIEYDRKKKSFKDKSKKVSRRSRSRSFTPPTRSHRPTTPDRRARSRSKKAKKKKHRDYSKEKPSTLTKEVFTSGQNILVSVNFNNQEEKSSQRRSKSRERDNREPKDIVDITARKKITINSKPVAIIDLARSPFRELTPEYQTNVIELSDSEGEKSSDKHPPKSPDSSSKLYDPFDILNSPTNENVTSSQTMNAAKLAEKIVEPPKVSMTYNKNIMALAATNLFFNEENLVSSSSMMLNDKQNPQPLVKVDTHHGDKNASKNESVPMDIVESPYSPGHEYDDSFPHDDGGDAGPANRGSKSANKGGNIFEDLFGTTTPPGLDRLKSSGKKGEKSILNFE
jgi:hypothetical protein